ncbi:MAG TPA: formyl transferase [Bryobacteraceae bacterium]|nr:formyl transferase [Bryobacteraceae bacterium]
MKIVFFTREGFEKNELFLYMYARVRSQFPDCCIVSVNLRAECRSVRNSLRKHCNKIRRLGWRQAAEVLSSYPLQLYFAERANRERTRLLRNLPRPAVELEQPVTIVHSVNGADAVDAIRRLRPDVIIQAGAGILKPQIFRLASIACLNMHHGIAPLIRGMNSIYWGLWERRPEWVGSTIHEIDAGIDTGNVLAYAPVAERRPGEGFARLFVRATELGIDRLLEVLARLQAGERWSVPPLSGASVYRSTISGWKLAALAWRLRGEREFLSGQGSHQTARS